MKTKLANFWERLVGSYWFFPGAMATASIVLAYGMLALDSRLDFDWSEVLGWVYSGGPQGARTLLSTIAGSMVTVAGVVFSIIIVALSQAAQQFGSRPLNNFMRDTSNQVVLGTFIATILYSLLVLRTIRDVEDIQFVPHLSVTLGLLLALISLGMLIYFISHSAASLQVENVISAVGNDFD